MTQEGRHLRLAKRRRMAPPGLVNETPDPVHIRLLRAPAVMHPPHRVVNLLQQPGLPPLRGFASSEIRHLTLLVQANVTGFIYSTPNHTDFARQSCGAYTNAPD